MNRRFHIQDQLIKQRNHIITLTISTYFHFRPIGYKVIFRQHVICPNMNP